MPGLDADLQLMIGAARDAGQIALGYWRKSPKVWEKPGGAGPVSEADLAVNDALEARLRGARPDYAWLSEESPDTSQRLSAGTVLVVDPIDGTRAFLAGEAHFAQSLALVRAGRPVAAVVYLPALDRLYTAVEGQGAQCNGQDLRCSQTALPEAAQVLTGKPSLSPEFWQEMPGFTRHFRASLAYRLCLVAEGRFDAILTFRPAWEWDIAAGALIAGCAGARVSEARGGPLRFNSAAAQTDGILAAPPLLHQALVQRMRRSAPPL